MLFMPPSTKRPTKPEAKRAHERGADRPEVRVGTLAPLDDRSGHDPLAHMPGNLIPLHSEESAQLLIGDPMCPSEQHTDRVGISGRRIGNRQAPFTSHGRQIASSRLPHDADRSKHDQ